MARRTYLYVGCYTNESPIGIRVYDSSDPHGSLVEQSVVEGLDHPSFLTTHPGGDVLYAVSETAPTGGIVALRVRPADGSLAVIDRAPSHGAAPCYVSVAADGRHLYAANYLSGTITVYALARDGSFGELVATIQHRGSGPHARQDGPHAHCILPEPGGGSVYAADLGTDRVSRYVHEQRDGRAVFVLDGELAFDAGTGPRHLAFHPEQPVGFVVGELDSTIVTIGVDPGGRPTSLHTTSTLPADFDGESIAADVRVHPGGRHVYVSNRGHDSIAVFGFDGADEPLVPMGHVSSGGATPRNLAVHPSGQTLFVANQDSNRVVPFQIDRTTGLPLQLRDNYCVPEPVCLTFLEVVR